MWTAEPVVRPETRVIERHGLQTTSIESTSRLTSRMSGPVDE